VTDSIIGEIPDTPGVHGVALAYDVGKGFTSNGRDSSVSVFDLKTLAVTGRIKLQQRNPDAILYDQASGRVFTFNGGSANTTAIDARTQKVVGTLALGGKPEAGVSDGTGRIYVNNEDSSTIVEFDARKLKSLHVWSLAPGESPSGLAIDRVHHRLFSGCDNQKLIVLDSETGRRVADLPIGEGVDGVAFDPVQQLVFSSNGEGTLTVIHENDPDHYIVLATVPTQKSGRTIALDPRDGRVYIPAAELGPPPAPTADRPHPRPSIVPGSFRVVVVHQ
jgi:DNA-binding beta-propeller fold protein YncE